MFLEYGFHIRNDFFCNRYQKDELQGTSCKYFNVTMKLKRKFHISFTLSVFFLQQGDLADSFFIVESGEVRIIMTRKVNIPKTQNFIFFLNLNIF